MSVLSDKPKDGLPHTEPLRGSEINEAFARFMPMFYAHINSILNRYKTNQYDLNENQIKVIMAVSFLGQMSPVQISRDLHIFKGSLTTIIRGLIEMGMLNRRDDPHDARKYYLSATDKARMLIREKTARDAARMNELFLNMPDADFDKVCKGLSILSDYLKETEKQ